MFQILVLSSFYHNFQSYQIRTTGCLKFWIANIWIISNSYFTIHCFLYVNAVRWIAKRLSFAEEEVFQQEDSCQSTFQSWKESKSSKKLAGKKIRSSIMWYLLLEPRNHDPEIVKEVFSGNALVMTGSPYRIKR